MRLFLAVAVLMLAFVAYTEAQEDTFQEKLSRFTDKLGEIGRQVGDHARNVWDSEPVAKSRNWLSEGFQTLREKLTQ